MCARVGVGVGLGVVQVELGRYSFPNKGVEEHHWCVHLLVDAG